MNLQCLLHKLNVSFIRSGISRVLKTFLHSRQKIHYMNFCSCIDSNPVSATVFFFWCPSSKIWQRVLFRVYDSRVFLQSSERVGLFSFLAFFYLCLILKKWGKNKTDTKDCLIWIIIKEKKSIKTWMKDKKNMFPKVLNPH